MLQMLRLAFLEFLKMALAMIIVLTIAGAGYYVGYRDAKRVARVSTFDAAWNVLHPDAGTP